MKLMTFWLIIFLVCMIFLISVLNKSSTAKANPFSFEEISKIPDFRQEVPHYVKSFDNIDLAFYPYLPNTEPQNVVLFYHGAGFYSNKAYQWIGFQLASLYKIGCYLVDIRGHGHSQGKHGDAPSDSAVWRDIHTMINLARERHPKAKIYLAGHSAGAGLILNYSAQQKKDEVDGFIFIAPYLGPESKALRENLSPEQSFAKKVRVWVYILNAIFSIEWLKHRTAVIFNYPQPLLENDCLIVPSYSYTMSMATTPMDPKKLFSQLNKPFGLYIGDHDEQFLPEQVIAYAEFANKVRNQSSVSIIEKAKHLSILLDTPELIAATLRKFSSK